MPTTRRLTVNRRVPMAIVFSGALAATAHLAQTGQESPDVLIVGAGKAALEGTFLGPGMYMGRIAGRRIARDMARTAPSTPKPLPASESVGSHASFSDADCLTCHDVAKDVARQRPGYWHYEQSHTKVLSRQYTCSSCHADLYPYRATTHRLDRTSLVTYCRACHGVQPREGPPARPGR